MGNHTIKKMFCRKCGATLEENAVFCRKCGTRVENVQENAGVENPSTVTENSAPTEPEVKVNAEPHIVEQPVMQQTAARTAPVPTQKVSEKPKMAWLTGKTIIGAIVALLVILVIVFIANMNKKVNLNDYLTVEYDGYNTIGTANWKFDREAFEKKYSTKLKINKKTIKKMLAEEGIAVDSIIGQEFMETDACELAEELISGSIDKSTELSNGDKITFTWDDLDDEYDVFNYDFQGKDAEFTVEGLEELAVFDPFEGVNVIFAGIAPYGTVQVEKSSQSGVYQSIYYEADASGSLSNGDEVTVTASCGGGDMKNYTASNYGMIPSETTKTYTVEGLSQYASAFEDISKETLAAMQQQGADIINASSVEWDERAKIASISYIGSYLLNQKTANTNDANILTLVFKVNVKIDSLDEDEEDVHEQISYYYPLSFEDIVILADGTTSTDLSSYKKPNSYVRKEYDFGGWWTKTFSFEGYEQLDTVFNKYVTAYVENYNYLSNVEDTNAASGN